jgi:hypothetical protein
MLLLIVYVWWGKEPLLGNVQGTKEKTTFAMQRQTPMDLLENRVFCAARADGRACNNVYRNTGSLFLLRSVSRCYKQDN